MAKAKGKEKHTVSEVEEATGDDITTEPAQSEPVKMEAEAETAVDAVSDNSEEEGEPEEADKMTEEAEKKEEAKEDGMVQDATTTDTRGDEKAEGDNKEEVKDDEKVENTSNKKAKRFRKKKAVNAAAAAASNNSDRPGPSTAEKGLKKPDGKGLIFMCNSKTKVDCFRYNVFGLPESKKEMVASVYKGMRLFLFDTDLKLMHGIYRAASPGGYNIEPKAFKSAFPSQVRFTILNDCNPLPEEKFKAAIKANYRGKNKFDVQLSQEQVKNLCKLFASSNKAPKQMRAGGTSKAPTFAGPDRRRRPPRDTVRHDNQYYPVGLTYPREGYAYERPIALSRPPPPPLYAYERPVDDYYYRREPRDRFMDLEMRPRDPVGYIDPHSVYREPPPYREAGYPTYAPPRPPYPY